MSDEEMGGDDRRARRAKQRSAPRHTDQKDFALEKKEQQRHAQAQKTVEEAQAKTQQLEQQKSEDAKYLKPSQKKKLLKDKE